MTTLKAAAAFVADITISTYSHALRFTQAGRLRVEPSRTHIAQSHRDVYANLAKRFSQDQLASIYELGKVYVQFGTEEFGQELEAAIARKLKKDKPAYDLSGVFFQNIPTPLSEIVLIKNLADEKTSFLYDPKTDVAYTQFDYILVQKTLRELIPDKQAFAGWLESNSRMCLKTYAPFKPRTFKSKENKCELFNTWRPAPWAEGLEVAFLDEAPARPEMFLSFIEFLVPDPADREMLLAWLRDCCWGRARQILVLCGLAGVGKGTLSKIVEKLVGTSNFALASCGFATSRFHGNITTKRAYFMDEADIDRPAKNLLKQLHNDTFTPERKGVEVGDPEPVHASIITANNYPERIQLEISDRKFFTPGLSKTPLKEFWPGKQIPKFLSLLDSDDYIKQIATYLYKTYEAGGSEKFEPNSYFRELCEGALSPIVKRIRAACREKPVVTYKDFGRTDKDGLTIQRLVQTYEMNARQKVCTFTIPPNNKWTAVSHIYEGEKSESEGDV